MSAEPASCCTPARASVALAAPAPRARTVRGAGELIPLPGGRFLMGTDNPDGYPADGEGPVREVVVAAFQIAATAVTNARFAKFVRATGYTTEAQRFGFSYVFGGFLTPEVAASAPEVESVPWWREVPGATWSRPEGRGSTVDDRQNHPVVHVSWNDAQAFCAWSGTRLPTEAEWEYAARGGLEQRVFPWGDELTPGGQHRANTWQGMFPILNTAQDGYPGTAPVRAYEPNGFGLYNTVGNVWEWCADWFGTDHAAVPAEGVARVMRGGSYLCHESYCTRYRVAARSKNTPDSSTGNIGFRVVADG